MRYYPKLICPFIVGWLFSLLLSCRSKENVLPGVASIQIILFQNKKPRPFYFLEDSAHNQLRFEVYYFDEKGTFIQPLATPQFLVNGSPIEADHFTLTKAGQFVFTAKIGNRISHNQLRVEAGSATDYISRFELTTAVPFLNANTTSRLPVFFTIVDKQGRTLDTTGYSLPIKLAVNGVTQVKNQFITATQAGIYTLQASLWGVKSTSLTVTARKPSSYELVRFPVIIHVPQSADVSQIDPARILAEVNQTYRARKASVDPNQADANIEFVPATTDPFGQPLAVAGLDRLSFDNPASVDTAARLVDRVVHQWCPQQYINVFMSVDWLRIYGRGFSYAYLPTNLTSSALTCEQLKEITWTATAIPAIYIYDQHSFEGLSHELGHFLGLTHTFANGCSYVGLFADIPQHEESFPDSRGYKYSCRHIPYVSDFVMDYHAPPNSFTLEQIQYIRLILSRLIYLPGSLKPGNAQLRKALPNELAQGTTIACKPVALGVTY
ncbi:M43 family zinc metalloprotease [Spirosoma pollinicola]|uniref:Peptidase M43 pregnancy-associated plasma-A domain-containing protein n=1 Tax=Spirosoma pollinicola TaxID=2057025 RepID=A0A2K8YT93_9BACT|nr:M43 family zinc metalloprotease [Spirosoma pollinicola]AUD00841.1 hypothetical protein CWM47_02825 [Spirosoma pollinicola]